MAYYIGGLIRLSEDEADTVNACAKLIASEGWTFDGSKQAIANGLHEIFRKFGQNGLDSAMGDLHTLERNRILGVVASTYYRLDSDTGGES